MKKLYKTKYRKGCMIFGQELICFEKYKEVACVHCHRTFKSNVNCIEGHHICDICHSVDSIERIENYCIETNKTNPIEMAIELMKNPYIKERRIDYDNKNGK